MGTGVRADPKEKTCILQEMPLACNVNSWEGQKIKSGPASPLSFAAPRCQTIRVKEFVQAVAVKSGLFFFGESHVGHPSKSLPTLKREDSKVK